MSVVNFKPRPYQPLIAASLQDLSAFINLLRTTADSAALVETNEGELVEALYFLHKKLRAQCDQLGRLL